MALRLSVRHDRLRRMDRIDDVPPSWDERATLTAMLDYVRDTMRTKCEGLDDSGARAAPLATSPLMSIAGLVSHARWVENDWFDRVLLGGEDVGPWTAEEPDREFTVALDVPLAQLLEDYATDAARHRETVARTDLDTRSVRTINTGETVTLRWILLHLIEETARHNGHIDILRELADGVTGT